VDLLNGLFGAITLEICAPALCQFLTVAAASISSQGLETQSAGSDLSSCAIGSFKPVIANKQIIRRL
jgi:hypothetical protein